MVGLCIAFNALALQTCRDTRDVVPWDTSVLHGQNFGTNSSCYTARSGQHACRDGVEMLLLKDVFCDQILGVLVDLWNWRNPVLRNRILEEGKK